MRGVERVCYMRGYVEGGKGCVMQEGGRTRSKYRGCPTRGREGGG